MNDNNEAGFNEMEHPPNVDGGNQDNGDGDEPDEWDEEDDEFAGERIANRPNVVIDGVNYG